MQPTGTATAVARADAADPGGSGSARRTGDVAGNPLARLAPRGPVEVLDGGFELFRFRIGRLVTLAAVLFGPIWLLDLGLLAAFGAPEVDRSAVGPAAQLLGTGAGWSWLIVLLNGFALSTLGLCVGALVMAWADDDDLSLGAVLGLAVRRSWVVLLLTPMCWVIKTPLAFCLPLVGFLIGDAFVFVASTVAGAERSGPLRSIARSFSLTKRNYGRALLVVAGSLVISQVLRSSFTLGPSAIAALLGGSDTLIVTLQRVSSAIVVVVEPLTACIAASAYLDLRCRNEAFDLVRRRQGRIARWALAR